MKTSDQLDKLAAALAIAQGLFVSPEKNRDVAVESDRARYSFAYATLDSVLDVVRKPLADNGLSIVQIVDEDPAPTPENPYAVIPRLVTRLLHSSGQWIEGGIRMQIERAGNQGVGSAITYMRRYGVMAILGICSATDDDDGNAGDGNRAHVRERQPRQQQEPRREAPKATPNASASPTNGKPTASATTTTAAKPSPPAAPTGSQPTRQELEHAHAGCARFIGGKPASALWKAHADPAARLAALLALSAACERLKSVMGDDALQLIQDEVDAAGNDEMQPAAARSMADRLIRQAEGEVIPPADPNAAAPV